MASQLFASHLACSWRCRSQQHASLLASAVTKSPSSVDDLKLKIYVALTCPNAPRSMDFAGRTLVHWAASCDNRTDLLEWLLDDFEVDIDSKDGESGYTSLHRALLHGQLASAQALIDRSASLGVFDNEGLTPLQLIRHDQGLNEFSLTGPAEVYSCGENATSNLGHRVPTERTIPDLVDYFSRRSISIAKVAMSKWHTAFLSSDGVLFTCGHGSFGRLGQGDFNDRTVPSRVQIVDDVCLSVAVGDEHTVVVTASGAAWAFGGNRQRQLGLNTTVESVSSPQSILLNKNAKAHKFIGCTCGDWCTVLWTDDLVYCCGQNDGQFGPCASKADASIGLRQLVGSSGVSFVGSDLLDVACGEAAIVILTAKHDVFLFENFECRRILSRILDLTRVVMNSTPLAKKQDRRHHPQQQQPVQSTHRPFVRLVFFSIGGNVYHWDTSDQVLRRCVFTGGVRRMIYPRTGSSFGVDGLYLITNDGLLYKGTLQRPSTSDSSSNAGNETDKCVTAAAASSGKENQHAAKTTTPGARKAQKGNFAPGDFEKAHRKAKEESGDYFAFRKTGPFLDVSDCRVVLLSPPIQAVHRAISVSSTSDGRNFCVIQQHPKADLTELPTKASSTMVEDCATLLDEAGTDDCLHDVQIRVNENGAQFRAAHKFILCSRCPYFSKRIQQSTTHLQLDEPPHIVSESALSRILMYIYTDDCDLLHVGPLHSIVDAENIEFVQPPLKSNKTHDPVRELLDAAKRLNMKPLTRRLENLRWDATTNSVVQVSRHRNVAGRPRFELNAFPEFCDVRLHSKDGAYLSAHRCVLSARSEYFRCMFASGWWSETTRNQTLNVDVESDVLSPVLHYLYTDDLLAHAFEDSTAKQRGLADEGLRATVDKDILEYYGRILVCADQWLLDRLRGLCEIELASRLTLRNVADILEFARMVNAEQLFASCAQFISLNLCPLLEANAFRNSSFDCLQRVGAYYRELYPTVGHRAIAPFCQSPDVAEIDSLWQEISTCGVEPVDILHEYSTAWERVQALGDSPSASGGKKKRPTATMTPRAKKTTSPLVNKPEPPFDAGRPSPKPAETADLDKKLRNNGQLESTVETPKKPASQPIAVPPSAERPRRPRNRPWNVASSPVDQFPEVSLRDLMQAEREKETSLITERRKSSTVAAVSPQTPPSNPRKLSAWNVPPPSSLGASAWPSLSTSPQQSHFSGAPKKGQEGEPSRNGERKRTFSEIVDEEKSKETERTRLLNKPLKIIQDEELAMQELALIYQIEDNWDELITVERAVISVAEPTWQAHVGSPPRF